MKLSNDNIRETVNQAKSLLAQEKKLSPALRAIINLLLLFVEAFIKRMNLNSKNSSKPPSSDQNNRSSKSNKSGKKPGGQPGHKGAQLKPVSDPDKVELLKIDRRTLPKGNYVEKGFEARQIIDFEVSIFVTEYRAQVLVDDNGKRYVADFPKHVKRPIQYGDKIKASAVYMSQSQLIPYARISEYFEEQIGFCISQGSLYNFNQEAYEALEGFEKIAKENLINSHCLHADETGININGKRVWLHTACSDKWTHFYPHAKRGSDAIEEIGILASFKGILCHDHWKVYFNYGKNHALCNAHHIRELEWAAKEEKQSWAQEMQTFLRQLNIKVDTAGGQLDKEEQEQERKTYKALLAQAQRECPLPEVPEGKKKRGRVAKTKSRNLLERLISYEDDVLRFMQDKRVPFTNNQGENDLRMTKVQQKISGCFRSEEGARFFCRIRGYLISCKKHGVDPTTALETLFSGQLPAFCHPPP